MKRATLIASVLFASLLFPSFADAADTQPPTVDRTDTNWRAGGYVESDLGVLLLFGGVGLFGGAKLGPLRAGLGFYRFDSPIRALSGAPDGFDLKVEATVALDVAWHPFSSTMEGFYVRAMAHRKWQRVENTDNGARRGLQSTLLGPEIGWVFPIWRGLYATPRVGALFYLERPQGPSGKPVDVGGKPYDNATHKLLDFYATAGLGIQF